jgi:ATP-dependent DNA helicase 2 subunit 1
MWDNLFEDDNEGQFEGNEEDSEFPFWMNRDSIIFLIDAQKSMFEENDSGEVPFVNAVKCAIATLTDKIISSDSDLLGIAFYGTREKNNSNDFNHVFVFTDLDVPDAQKIIDLETLLNNDFSKDFGHTDEEFPFCDALWACSTMFSNCTVKVGHKRIFLFTNDDNPNVANAHLRNQSIQRAKDLAELGIEIELFSMNKMNSQFDPTLFYHDIITVAEEDDTGKPNFDAAAKFEELRARVRRKEFKKRSIGRMSMMIGKDIEIAVRLYNLVQETKKGSYVWLDSRTNQQLKKMTKYICEDTGSMLLDTQVRNSYTYGGERVFFDKEEIQKIKLCEKSSFHLMGFKPRNTLKDYYNIKHASFIYPDEYAIKGSTVAFSALLDRMLAADKIAVCRMTKTSSPPKFVALVPQKEELDKEGIQVTPPGMHVILLPFADDIRSLRFETQPKANNDQIGKAKRLVKTLRIRFDSRNFENPSLQRHYANLQALALDRETTEETPDYVVPDEEGMSKYEELITDFKTSVLPDGYDPDPKKTPNKTPKASRKRPREDDDETGPSPKRQKRDGSAAAERNWQQLVASGDISSLKVDELKEYIAWKGIKNTSKLKKHELVDLIKNHVNGEDE